MNKTISDLVVCRATKGGYRNRAFYALFLRKNHTGFATISNKTLKLD